MCDRTTPASPELCTDALGMALSLRQPPRGLPHHSDRGIQYCCDDYQRLLSANPIECSMSRRGDGYDNAAMESFGGTLKQELVRQPRSIRGQPQLTQVDAPTISGEG